jgi:glycosyltransferase involved in cell wall biosynthesis
VRIYFLPSDLDGPGSYRCIFPALELAKNTDWDIRVCEFKFYRSPARNKLADFFKEVTLPPPDQVDLFVVHRRFESEVTEFCKEVQAHGGLVVASTDDDDIHLPPWHSAFGKGQGGSQNIDRRNWHRTVELADALIVSTPALAHAYRRHNRNVHVLPNYLDWRMWHAVSPSFERAEPKRLRVGWLGDPKLRDGDLKVLRAFLPAWLKRHPEVDFVSAGSDKTHDLIGIPEGQRVTLPGIAFIERRLHELLDFQIGLIPLADCKFNEAKSHLKGLEYAACGIPALASPSASYRDWLGDGDCGFLARSPKEWSQSLDLLAADGDLRRRMGVAARARAREHSLDNHWQEWAEALEAIHHRADARKAVLAPGLGVDQAAA